MKFNFYLFFLSIVIFSCNAKHEEKKEIAEDGEVAILNSIGGYGAAIDTMGAIEVDSLYKLMEHNNSLNNILVLGSVVDVCQTKGCWMNLKSSTKNMRVGFKDYAFFVPMDCANQFVYARGMAKWDTTSVEMLKHLAEDANQSKEEIEKINQPEIELVFEAEGVLFKK